MESNFPYIIVSLRQGIEGWGGEDSFFKQGTGGQRSQGQLGKP